MRDIIPLLHARAGVRNLEREVSKICRKAGQGTDAEGSPRTGTSPPRSTSQRPRPPSVSAAAGRAASTAAISTSTRVQKFTFGRAELQGWPGPVWPGPRLAAISIEATVVPGMGKLIHTGQLGDAMQESIQAALSVVRAARRARASILSSTRSRHPPRSGGRHAQGRSRSAGTHVHGAGVGPDARSGALRSGDDRRDRCAAVPPIGGLKEKRLAAHRGGITTVMIPEENKKDLADIPEEHDRVARDQRCAGRRGGSPGVFGWGRGGRLPVRRRRRWKPEDAATPGVAEGAAARTAVRAPGLAAQRDDHRKAPGEKREIARCAMCDAPGAGIKARRGSGRITVTAAVDHQSRQAARTRRSAPRGIHVPTSCGASSK